MEGQALPRLHPLTMHHLNKGRHHNQNVSSPPLSPTAVTAPTSNSDTPNVKPPKTTISSAKSSQNGANAQKRGWLSFDDSPVHSQPGMAAILQSEKVAIKNNSMNKQPVSKSFSSDDVGYKLNKFTPEITHRVPYQVKPSAFSLSTGSFDLLLRKSKTLNMPQQCSNRPRVFNEFSNVKSVKTTANENIQSVENDQRSLSPHCGKLTKQDAECVATCVSTSTFSNSFNSLALNNLFESAPEVGGVNVASYATGHSETNKLLCDADNLNNMDNLKNSRLKLKSQWSPSSMFRNDKRKTKVQASESSPVKKAEKPKPYSIAESIQRSDGSFGKDFIKLSPLPLDGDMPPLSSSSCEDLPIDSENILSFSWPSTNFRKQDSAIEKTEIKLNKTSPCGDSDKSSSKMSPLLGRLKKVVLSAIPKKDKDVAETSCSSNVQRSTVCSSAITIPSSKTFRSGSISKSWDSSQGSGFSMYLEDHASSGSGTGLLSKGFKITSNKNFPAGQSPWAATGNEKQKQWTPFAEGETKPDVVSNPTVQPTRIPPLDASQQTPQTHAATPVSNTPVKPTQPVPTYHSTPSAHANNQHEFATKPNLVESSGQPYPSADVRHRRRVASKEDEMGRLDSTDSSSDFQDPWCINIEQREYYTKQFATMQPDLEGKINGQSARNFFTKSKLPILELSHIWELSDMDQDGHLTLDEFCTAFHLVVARKNGYELPPQLPQALVPTLIDISGDNVKNISDVNILEVGKNQASANHMVTSPKEQKQEQWETFSDRTSSSTTLANFDQVLDSTTEHLHHPVAMRMTPSRHHEHWKRVSEPGGDAVESQSKTETLDEESTTSSPQTRTKAMTNPYGYLQNEPDSAGEDPGIKQTRLSSSSDSTTNVLEAASDKSYKKHKAKGRSHSNSSLSSSTSSVATSERSSDEDNFHDSQVRSDPEHSDWSSRPLRPSLLNIDFEDAAKNVANLTFRSGSSSSLESGSVPPVAAPPPPAAAAPTPPPRPQVHSQKHTASPIPKPRPVAAKTNSSDKSKLKPPAKEQEARVDGPTPPPRPQQATNQESFADFSNFNQSNQPEEDSQQPAPTPAGKTVEKKHQQSEKPIKQETPSAKESGDKPVPAPRPQKESLKSNESLENETKEIETDKSLHGKKAPAKPPRSRMLSADVCKPEPILTPLTVKSNDDAKIPDPPKQEAKRQKSQLQSTIRELKNRNTQLTRLNGDLQQQLKDVMEKRITVEMTIHQMRPFTQ